MRHLHLSNATLATGTLVWSEQRKREEITQWARKLLFARVTHPSLRSAGSVRRFRHRGGQVEAFVASRAGDAWLPADDLTEVVDHA